MVRVLHSVSASSDNRRADEGACTLEEARVLRRRLRIVGQDRFLAETVEAGTYTSKKLCTAFGIRLPFFLEGEPDEAYYYPLRIGIIRELHKRVKLPQYNTLEDAVALIKKSKNIVVLTGAGVISWRLSFLNNRLIWASRYLPA